MSTFPDSHDNSERLVGAWMVSSFQGKLLTLIEAMGLPKTQEDSVKSLVKNELWQWFYVSQRLVQCNVEDGRVHKLEEIRYRFQMDSELIGSNAPVSRKRK